MRRATFTILCLSLALTAIACEHADPANTNDATDTYTGSDASDTSTDTADTADTADATDADVIPDTTPPPVDWATANWCSPRPLAYDVDQIPRLPDDVALAGFCEVPTLDAPLDSEGNAVLATHTFTLDDATQTIHVTNTTLENPSASIQRHEFDAEGRARRIEAEGSRGFYDNSYGLTTYELNEAGEVTYKLAISKPFPEAEEETWTVIEKTQTWDGDRLLSRVERDGVDGPILREWTWTWDGDLMTGASLTDHTLPDGARAWSSAFVYGGDGELLEAVRRVDEVEAEVQTWRYDDGLLTSRSYWRASPEALAAAHGGEAREWQTHEMIDTLQHRPALYDYTTSAWPLAVPTMQGDCAQLPQGPGHGYPDAEPEYQLGVEVEGRPAGIGFAYGNDSYGWFYGDHAWYGHDGLGSGWLSNVHDNGPALMATTVYYTNGVMTSETATVTASDVQYEVQRDRALDAEGGIVEDTLVATWDGQTHTRALRFERDDDGLIQRDLTVEGVVREQQLWTRDAEGRALSHTVLPVSTWRDIVTRFEGWDALFGGFSYQSTDGTAATWSWRYEEDRMVERSGPQALHQTLRYDAAGRLVEVDGRFTPMESGSQAWRYDDAGRLVEHCRGEDEWRTCNVSTRDEAGRVAWRETLSAQNAPYITLRNTYECTP